MNMISALSRETMNDVQHCRTCGISLPPDAPGPQCGRCRCLGSLLLSGSAAEAESAAPGLAASVEETGEDFGDFVLLKEIARGGMGIVHRARQKSLNRIVALKRPLPGVAADPESVARFRSEAKAVAGLSHPNIIPVFESGAVDGEQYFSMAYVEGEPLSERLHRQAVPAAKAAMYVRKVAGAIYHAHQRGILHRDLKPANILIDASDEPRVADFGIACLLHGAGRESAAAVAGTASYMAPEQFVPGANGLSVATDIYALGGILYHLITGRPPFTGETQQETLWSVYYEEPIHPGALNTGISPDLEAICLKALQKVPEHRYETAQALAEDLARFEAGRPVLARPVSFPVRCWMWVRRNPLVFLLLLALAIALASVLAVQMTSIRKVRSARADSEGIIGFMNQDLARDLREVGRLDLMEKINARAEEYYTNHTALGDASYLERKATFFENAAVVKKDLGELAQAEAHATEAERIYESQHTLTPGESRWQRHQSRARLLRQEIARKAGLRPVAGAHGDQAVALATAATETDETDPTNRAHLASVLLEHAAFQIGLNQTEQPLKNIERAGELLRSVSSEVDAPPDWSLWLATVAYYRGRVAELRGEREAALAHFNSYLEAVQGIATRDPRNRRWQYELALANSQIASTLVGLKEPVTARPYLDAFESLTRDLIQSDPRNKTWLSLHAKSLAWQGVGAGWSNDQGRTALGHLRAALVIQSNLVHQNPDWDQWVENLGETTRAMIQQQVQAGRSEEALATATHWTRECEKRALSDPAHIGHQQRWGMAIVSEARERARQQGPAAQVATLEAALTKFPNNTSNQPVALALSRVLSALADARDKEGFPDRAAVVLEQALELRLGFFSVSPMNGRLRDQIPDNFLWVTRYRLKSGDVAGAMATAGRGLNWAAKHLVPEENRRDFGEMCVLLTEVSAANPDALREVRNLVRRCLAERFRPPPALTAREQSLADLLAQWIAQEP